MKESHQPSQPPSQPPQPHQPHHQSSQSFHHQNILHLRQKLTQPSDPKLSSFLQYLEEHYPPGSTKINLGSIYQIPIQAKGVQVLMEYCFWSIDMLNLTMHKLENEGFQHVLRRVLPKQQEGQLFSQHQPWMSLSEISIIRNNITSDGFKNIEKTPLTNLKILRASYNKIDHQAINKIIKCDWPNLIELQFGNNQIGKQGCKLLMLSKWKHFRRLDLNYNLIENEGVHYLSEADWPQLTQLNLSNNKIDASATVYMKKANWPKLQSLMLNKNLIGKVREKQSNSGCQNLCLLKTLSLEKLSLYGNEITLNGIMMLLHSDKLAPGCFLELSRNHFRFYDIKETLKQQDRFCNEFQN